MNNTNRYIVETTVNLQEGKTKEVLEFFKSTNSQLVSDESDWIKASFSSVEEKDINLILGEKKGTQLHFWFMEGKDNLEILEI